MPFEDRIKQALINMLVSAEKLVRGNPAHTLEDLSRIRDFLFLQYNNNLSDCVHDTPIYEALHTCLPDARITVATRGTGFETLRHNPFVDQLIATSDPHMETAQTARELRRECKRRRIQPAIGITSFSNAETNLALVNALAGKHIRLGHTVLPGLYHLPQKYDHTMSLIHNNLCLVTIFNCPTGHLEPRVFFREQDVEKVLDLLREKGILKQAPLTVFVTEDSDGRKTGWHTKRFAQVIRYVSRQSQIVFVGAAHEAAAIEALRTEAAVLDDFRTASVAGETTIPELAALLCVADYVISLDTGAMHVGRAAEAPMVVLAPSWRHPLKWLPLGMERIRIVRGEDSDELSDDYQLDEIEAHHVIDAFDELVRLYPPSHLERDARIRNSISIVDHAGQG